MLFLFKSAIRVDPVRLLYPPDEMSVVGSGMLNFLNLRLQQIMGTNEPFGGISLVSFGDLFQLKPAFDK